jgi:hypothetical protein
MLFGSVGSQQNAEVEPTTGWARTRPLGYGLVVLTGLLLGTVGIIPFVILGYGVTQWVLAPLGLAAVDTSNNDGVGGLLIGGVYPAFAIVFAWAGLVSWWTRRFVLTQLLAWPMAVAALIMPLVLFVAVKTV